MNVQTERIDNHKAQFTVEIEAKQFDDAKRKAAKKIARSVRIKGFRKGKAPYRIISQYVGEAAILEEAVEILGNDIYKDALEESGVEPYGPGSLDDFKIEPSPTFIFSVPLQPEVDLKGYTDTRLDFEAPEVSDEDVENALKQIQRQEAEVINDEVEEAVLGNRVTIDLHSEFVDGEEPEADADEEDEEEASTDDEAETETEDGDEEEQYVPKKGDEFIHRHDAVIVLDESDGAVLPGFAKAMVGATLEEPVEFELSIPEDDEDYEIIAGRTVKFSVTVKKIEEIAMPELDDALAAKVSELDGDEPLDLDGLRQRTRDELEKEALENAKSQYGDSVLKQIVAGAEVSFPELVVEEQIEDMLRDLDRNLQQQGLNLDTYMRITGTSMDSLKEQYYDNAVESVSRTLVLRELISAQEINVDDELIDKRIDDMLMQFGAQGDQFRQMIDTPQMRQNILNELLIDNIMTRLIAIGRGEDPIQAVEDRRAEQEVENAKARERVERMLAKQEAEDEASAVAGEDLIDPDSEVVIVGEATEVVEETDVEETADDAEDTEETDDDSSEETEDEA